MSEKSAIESSKNPTNTKDKQFYLVGGGIASLSSAAYLIKDGHIPAKNIHILEETKITGGSMDGAGEKEKGYVIRGGRMFDEEAYQCTYDLMKIIPSLTDPKKTIRDEMIEFNKMIQTDGKARLVDHDGKIIDVSTIGISLKDKYDLTKMIVQSEDSLGKKRIDECFSPKFFKTKFWYMWSTTFAFQPWHSAVEFKRYLHRFVHELPKINNLGGVKRTPLNQYDSIILPTTKWLKDQGVDFVMDTKVNDFSFKTNGKDKSVDKILCTTDGKDGEIVVKDNDYVFATIGSMTAGASLGTMTKAPTLENKTVGGAWTLWENIAKNNPEFGHPSVFDDHVDESKWESFTVTLKDPTFFDMMEKFTGNKAGTGALVTFKDSNWLMSVVLAHQPHFIDQPKDVQVFWGYSLYPDKKGNFVDKKMSDCTGEEILTELCNHLKFDKEMPKILESANCIPCMLPFITSQFLTREKGDRPPVIPQGTKNFALLGQYTEIPDDVVFTVDYSVRSAQTAVYSLLNLDKKVTPIYKGQYDLKVMIDCAKTMIKDTNFKSVLEPISNMVNDATNSYKKISIPSMDKVTETIKKVETASVAKANSYFEYLVNKLTKTNKIELPMQKVNTPKRELMGMNM